MFSDKTTFIFGLKAESKLFLYLHVSIEFCNASLIATYLSKYRFLPIIVFKGFCRSKLKPMFCGMNPSVLTLFSNLW